MEIGEYLGIIRKRIVVVVLIPLLAIAVTVPLVLNKPRQYSATATVAGPLLISRAPGSPYDTSNGARQFVADFLAAASLPSVVEATAKATGATQDEIRGNVSATPIGQSSLIQVRYLTTDAPKAGPVVDTLALQTLEFLFRPAAESQASSSGQAGSNRILGPVKRLNALLQQPETLTVSSTTISSRGPELMRALQLAVATGVLLALLVVILLEVLPFHRRRTQEGEESTKVLEETAA